MGGPKKPVSSTKVLNSAHTYYQNSDGTVEELLNPRPTESKLLSRLTLEWLLNTFSHVHRGKERHLQMTVLNHGCWPFNFWCKSVSVSNLQICIRSSQQLNGNWSHVVWLCLCKGRTFWCAQLISYGMLWKVTLEVWWSRPVKHLPINLP